MDIQSVWKNILKELEISVSSVAYDLWIKSLTPIDIQNNKLILACPSDSENTIKTIEKNYKQKILEALLKVNATIGDIKIIPSSGVDKYLSTKAKPEEVKVASEDGTMILFNSKYTFDNFVVGNSNNVVNAAARAVAEKPGISFNPLFIYGGVGLGKTHLMHAIGNYINEHNKNLIVTYVTTESFMNELIDAIRSGQDKNMTKQFRDKYRNVDVLMIDDIQFISNKTGTQEEFFHTFNNLYDNNKQIIISSDRPPKDLSHLEERLRSRFQGGLIADITPPDIETRIAILQKKTEQAHLDIPFDVIKYIAENFDTNIRELEGLLTKIDFYASLMNKRDITLELTKDALKDCTVSKKEALSKDKIIENVCAYYKIDKASLIGKKRNKELVEARHVCIYLIYDLLTLPLTAIGEIMGNRDHTSIMHARDNILEKLKNSHSKICADIDDIKARLTETR